MRQVGLGLNLVFDKKKLGQKLLMYQCFIEKQDVIAQHSKFLADFCLGKVLKYFLKKCNEF